MAAIPRFELRFLGPVQIQRDGAPLCGLESRKALGLLAYLAVAGQPVPRERLAGLFWPDKTEAKGRANLSWVLSKISGLLPDCVYADRYSVQMGHVKQGNDYWVDLQAFEDLQGQGDVAALAEAAELYRGEFLEGLYLRGCAEFELWQVREQERWRQRVAAVLEELVARHSQRGEYEEGVRLARRLLGLEPWREAVHREVMRLLAWDGQRGAALAQYEACREALAEELGVEPGDETAALYEQIRAGELKGPLLQIMREPNGVDFGVPATVEGAVAPSPEEIPPAPEKRVQAPAFLDQDAPEMALQRPIFVGRERELARLEGHLRRALQGEGQVVFVTGGAGCGKTALIQEFARRAQEAHAELVVAWGNCNAFSGSRDPYLPFRELLGMLTGDVEARWTVGTITTGHARRLWGLLPQTIQALLSYGSSLIGTFLSGPTLLARATSALPDDDEDLSQLQSLVERSKSGETTDLEQRFLLEQYTNVLRTVAEHRPMLLVLDDLQWADTASAELLFHLGRRTPRLGAPVMIIGAYRPEELDLGRDGERHPLDKVLSELKRNFGDIFVDLAQAGKAEGRSFVDALVDSEPNQLDREFRDKVFERTQAHPLFTVELLHAMRARGDLLVGADSAWVPGQQLDWETLPARVEGVIEERVARLDPGLQEVLAVASVEGETFTAEVVARVLEVDEWDLLRELSQELGRRHRLVREREQTPIDGRLLSRYQFSHVLFQSYVYNRLSRGERRLLHARIAHCLEELYEGRSDEIAVPLAHHFEASGQVTKAVEHLLVSGIQAHRAYANREAVVNYRRALDLLAQGSSAQKRNADLRLRALKGLGSAHQMIGEIEAAEKCFVEAIALGKKLRLGPREIARLLGLLADVVFVQNRYREQLRLAEEGLGLLRQDPDSMGSAESVEAVLMRHHAAVAHLFLGNQEKSDEISRGTARFVLELPYSPLLRPVYVSIAFMYEESKEVDKALKWFRILENRAQEHGDLSGVCDARRGAGLALVWRGDLRAGIVRLILALDLAESLEDLVTRMWGSNNLSSAYLQGGDIDKAGVYAHRCLEIARELGSRRDIRSACEQLGWVALCKRDWPEAVKFLNRATGHSNDADDPSDAAWGRFALSRAHLALGERDVAQECLEKVAEIAASGPLRYDQSLWHDQPYRHDHNLLAAALGELEVAYDNPEEFREFCDGIRARHAKVNDSPFVQWFVERVEIEPFREPPFFNEEFETSLEPGWVWHDPLGDCAHFVEHGCELIAANGRCLWRTNLSAPRLLRPAPGAKDWTAQVVCIPWWDDRPAFGGLLLWVDKHNYLRLGVSLRPEYGISLEFGGCIRMHDSTVGRGRLPLDALENAPDASSEGTSASRRIVLRLRRSEEQVEALCSPGGIDWYTVGRIAFPSVDCVEIGLYALGLFDRSVYRGECTDGTAIKFESFTLWDESILGPLR